MKVADSSYLVEGLLKTKALFEDDILVSLDLAVYEAANSVWKHEFLLKDIEDGELYLAILRGLIESGRIELVHASKEVMEVAYTLAAKCKRPVCDTVFVALALELESDFVTFDKRQAALYKRIRNEKVSIHSSRDYMRS